MEEIDFERSKHSFTYNQNGKLLNLTRCSKLLHLFLYHEDLLFISHRKQFLNKQVSLFASNQTATDIKILRPWPARLNRTLFNNKQVPVKLFMKSLKRFCSVPCRAAKVAGLISFNVFVRLSSGFKVDL